MDANAIRNGVDVERGISQGEMEMLFVEILRGPDYLPRDRDSTTVAAVCIGWGAVIIRHSVMRSQK